MSYDFKNEKSTYPIPANYPATMPTQVAEKLISDFCYTPKDKVFLDPFCGSGSSLVGAIAKGFSYAYGMDENPHALLLTKFRTTTIHQSLYYDALAQFNGTNNNYNIPQKNYSDISYWYSQNTFDILLNIYNKIFSLGNHPARVIFDVAFSNLSRYVSHTRQNELKLWRKETLQEFDVKAEWERILDETSTIYYKIYYPLLEKQSCAVTLDNSFDSETGYDFLLTSPPYGDSFTTVAYGQSSFFSNWWHQNDSVARLVDKTLLGGRRPSPHLEDYPILQKFSIYDNIMQIRNKNHSRAIKVALFYNDLWAYLSTILDYANHDAVLAFVTGNRTVSGIELSLDNFIVEFLVSSGFHHIFNDTRVISNRKFPSQNSPTNQTGVTGKMMTKEDINIFKKG